MNNLEISDLIRHIKKELTIFSEDTDILFVEEINLEINYMISGNIDGGFSLGVVTLDSNVTENKIQKICLKLVPIMSKDAILSSLPQEKQDRLASASSNILFKGGRTKG